MSEFIAGTGLVCGWPVGTNGWGVHMDNNLLSIGMTPGTRPVVIDYLTATPPSAPSQGDRYIIPAGATGVWAGQTDKLAYFSGNAWSFFTPSDGWVAVVRNRGVLEFRGGSWVPTFPVTTSWTPTLFGATTAGTPTYSAQTGTTTRAGDFIHVSLNVQLSSMGGIAGTLRIGGIPSWSAVATAARGPRLVCEVTGSAQMIPKPVHISAVPGQSFYTLVMHTPGTVFLTGTDLTSSFRVRGTIILGL